MFKIVLLNVATQQTFEKEYDSYYLYNKDLNKYKHSKKLMIVGDMKIC